MYSYQETYQIHVEHAQMGISFRTHAHGDAEKVLDLEAEI